MNKWIDRLAEQQQLPSEGYKALLECDNEQAARLLQERAQSITCAHFGKEVYIRGLIEISSYCRNNCYYCGLRAANGEASRYRLDTETILECCAEGYSLGFRTFVLQGGEDPRLDIDSTESLVAKIHHRYPDCAITLSLGEMSHAHYKRLFDAGASRYLLRHESFNADHYTSLHPPTMSRDNRLACLQSLKEIGYQCGTGIMVGSPGQSIETLVEDLLFIERFKPAMIGIGPFIAHHATPFAAEPSGSVELTLKLISIFRLMNPTALIPATTALASLATDGRERGILAGANVVMPNLSPRDNRHKYSIYDNKAAFGSEAAEGLTLLEKQLSSIGYTISSSRGDNPNFIK